MANSLVAEGYLKIRTDLNAMRSELRVATSIFRSAISQMAGVAGGILAAAGIRKFSDELRYVMGQFISVNNMFEQYQVSLGQLFKSEALARSMITEIQEMARLTPFRMDTLTQAVVQLKIFGFENEKLIPTMRAVGDAAAASPRGMLDGVQRISYAIGEMRSHGRIMAAEMRQLASAGVPAWDLLAKKSGKSITELRTMMRQGAVDSATYLPLLIEGMAERFEGMMQKQSRTWGGLYSTMQDNIMILFKDVGRPFFDVAKARLAGIVDFMDTSKYREFIPRMQEAVKTVSKFADNKISMAFKWLTGPSAYHFGQQMKEAAGEVMRISQMGHDGMMRFLNSENVRTAARWTGEMAVSLARISRIAFTNVMDFLRGDTWASIVRGAKDYASQLFGIARIGFEQAREFLNSRNFELLTGEARRFAGWLMEVRRIALDFAGDKLAEGMAWLRSDRAAEIGVQFKAIALHVKGIATVTASNFWTFFTSDNLKLIALDLRDAAFHVMQIAGVKLVAFSQWLNSAEATQITAGIRRITSSLIYLVDNFGGLFFGVFAMVQFRTEIGLVASGFISLVTTIRTCGLLAILSPTGLIVAGIVAIGAAFVGARYEGERFFDYIVKMFGRLTAGANGATDAISRLRRAERREIDQAEAVGDAEAALAGDDTQENVDAAKLGRDDLVQIEKDAQAEVRKRRREFDEAYKEAYKQAYIYSGGQASPEVLADRANNYGSVKGARTELENAELAAQSARNNLARIDEQIAEKQKRVDDRRRQISADAKIERDAGKATGMFQTFNSGAGIPWGGMAAELTPTSESIARARARRDAMFQQVGNVSMDPNVGWARSAARGPSLEALQRFGSPEAARAAKLASMDRRRSMIGALQHPLISHFRDMARSGLGTGMLQTLGSPEQLRAHQLIANSNMFYKQGGLRGGGETEFSKAKDARRLEYLESRSEERLTKKQRGELARLRGAGGEDDLADDTTPGSAKGKRPKGEFAISGVAEFARQLMVSVNKSAEEDAAIKTAGNTDKMAVALQKIEKEGVKIKNPPPSTTS